jgi:hypothetical protein
MANALGVAGGHVHDRRTDLNSVTGRLLKATAAIITGDHRDLIAGATWIGGRRFTKDVARHEQKSGVVIEPFAAVLPKLLHGFSKGGECLSSYIESEYVAWCFRSRIVARPVSPHVALNQPFDLPNGATPSGVEPLALGLGGGHSSQLAHCRPVHATFAERTGELRQLFECLGGAQFVVGRAWPIAEEAFDILDEAAVTEVPMRLRAQGAQERAPLFGVLRGPLRRQTR